MTNTTMEEKRAREVLAVEWISRGEPSEYAGQHAEHLLSADSLGSADAITIAAMLTFADEARVAERERCILLLNEIYDQSDPFHDGDCERGVLTQLLTAIRKPQS